MKGTKTVVKYIEHTYPQVYMLKGWERTFSLNKQKNSQATIKYY